MKTSLFAALGCVALLVASVMAEDKKEEGVKLEGVKCIVAGNKPANGAKSVEYKGAKVFFCCDGCPEAFKKDTAKFASKANMQLVATGQAKQVACPLSGGKLNDATAIKVGTVEVKFCCEKCQGKAKDAKDAEQLELIFSDKAFDKGFKVTTAEKK